MKRRLRDDKIRNSKIRPRLLIRGLMVVIFMLIFGDASDTNIVKNILKCLLY